MGQAVRLWLGPRRRRRPRGRGRTAVEVVGHPVLHLPLPDAPYRAKFPLEHVVAELTAVFRPGVRVFWAPLADHRPGTPIRIRSWE